MKTKYTICIIANCLISFISASIINNSFESWNTKGITGWVTTNGLTLFMNPRVSLVR